MPTIGYLDQIKLMLREKSSSNVKLHSSAILLISNMLRIIYWFQRSFQTYLLIQSICMVSVQTLFTVLYYGYKRNDSKVCSSVIKNEDDNEDLLPKIESNQIFRIYNRFKPKNTFLQLTISIILLIFVALIASLCFSHIFGQEIIASIVGVLANTIDCFVTFPQFILICIQRNIRYVTPLLVLQWIGAVICKTVLYIFGPVPWPFILGLVLQALFTFCLTFSYLHIKFCGGKHVDEESDNEMNISQIDTEMKLSKTEFPEISSNISEICQEEANSQQQ